MAEPFSNLFHQNTVFFIRYYGGFQGLKIQGLAQSATKCEPILYPQRGDFYVSGLHILLLH